MQRALAVSLAVWACGVQLHEGISTVGSAATAVLIIAGSWRQWRALAAWWPLFGWLAWALLVPLLGGHLPTGAGLARLSDWLLWPVALAAFTRLEARQLERVGAALLVTTVLTCSVAGLQHFGIWPPLETFSGLEWTKIPFERMYEAVPGSEGRFMGGGLMFHRLKFAHVTGLVSVWAISTRRPAAALVGAFGLMSVLVFPYARQGAAAAALATAFVIFERRRVAGLAVAGACALVVVAIPSVRSRFATSLTGEGSGERVELWKTGVNAVEDHPLTGIGAGRFKPAVYGTASTPQLVLDNLGKAHNQLLSMAAELGVPGALLFLVMLMLLRAKLWLPALVHLFALSFTHDPLIHETYGAALMLALATAGARATQTSVTPGASPR